jgi:hypothetical protein
MNKLKNEITLILKTHKKELQADSQALHEIFDILRSDKKPSVLFDEISDIVQRLKELKKTMREKNEQENKAM